MIKPLDEIPEYLEEEVRNRIAAGANRSILIADDDKGEFLVAYTDFTKTAKEKYQNACEERGQDAVKVYQLTMDSSGVQVARYESTRGQNAEQIWRERVQ